MWSEKPGTQWQCLSDLYAVSRRGRLDWPCTAPPVAEAWPRDATSRHSPGRATPTTTPPVPGLRGRCRGHACRRVSCRPTPPQRGQHSRARVRGAARESTRKSPSGRQDDAGGRETRTGLRRGLLASGVIRMTHDNQPMTRSAGLLPLLLVPFAAGWAPCLPPKIAKKNAFLKKKLLKKQKARVLVAGGAALVAAGAGAAALSRANAGRLVYEPPAGSMGEFRRAFSERELGRVGCLERNRRF